MTRRVYWCSRCEYIGDKPDHVDHAEDRWCTGVPVERWLIDPAEAFAGWRLLDPLDPTGYFTVKVGPLRAAFHAEAVMVVPVPDPPTNQESA